MLRRRGHERGRQAEEAKERIGEAASVDDFSRCEQQQREQHARRRVAGWRVAAARVTAAARVESRARWHGGERDHPITLGRAQVGRARARRTQCARWLGLGGRDLRLPLGHKLLCAAVHQPAQIAAAAVSDDPAAHVAL